MALQYPTMTPTAQEHEEMEFQFQDLLSVQEELGKANHRLDQLMACKVIDYTSACTEDDFKHDNESLLRTCGDPDYWSEFDNFPGRGDSLEKLDSSIEDVKGLCATLEKSHQKARLSFNSLCSPCLRKLSILDLPDELLLEIFRHVEGYDRNYPEVARRLIGRSAATVNNLRKYRLVCRRFNAVSSEFLLHTVVVAFNEESLRRFEEISRHPVISKGVVDVQITLELHGCRLYNFRDFISHLHGRLLSLLDYYGTYETHWDTSTVSEEEFNELVSDAESFTRMLRGIWRPDHSLQRDDFENLARLQDLHEKYRRLLGSERALITSWWVFRFIAESMARLRTRRLTFANIISRVKGETSLMRHGIPMWHTVEKYVVRSMAQGRLLHIVDPDESPWFDRSGAIIIPLLDALQDCGVFPTSSTSASTILWDSAASALTKTLELGFPPG